MSNKPLIDFDSFEVKYSLPKLLKDKTTNRNIIFATENYESLGESFKKTSPVTEKALKQIDLKPRVLKSIEAQKSRTKSKAEVFTPSWICNQMNNHCDEIWFGKKDVFNIEEDKTWKTKKEKIVFPEGKSWFDYIELRRLEITCGEAPFIVSRYDTSSGKYINVKDRIGFLDRKIRVISENINEEDKWIGYVMRAYKSTYAYEFQGDNLILARLNLLLTFVEHLNNKWHRKPTMKELDIISNIIVKNIWQMDAFTECPPYLDPDETIVDNNGNEIKKNKCKVFDWTDKSGRFVLFEKLKGEIGRAHV